MLLKKTLLLLLFTSVFACQQQSDTIKLAPPTTSLTTDSTVTSAKPAALRFSPIISGYWLSAQYRKVLEQTRSPAEAFEHTPSGPSSIHIEPFSSQIDSVEIGATYGLHEGGNRTLLLRSGRNDNTLSLRPQLGDKQGTVVELSYEISAADTTLFFVQRDAKTNQIIDKIPYYRALKSSVKTDLQGGVERAINQLLITGQYQSTDSLGQLVSAYFLSDGKVKGLPFSKYTVQMDFTGPNPGDELIFDVYSKRQSSFGASFSRDTLRLYTVLHTVGVAPGETDTTELFSRGRLRYQLVRVRKP